METNDQDNLQARLPMADKLQWRDRELQLLLQATQQINTRLEVPTILRQLVTAALELTGATGGAAGLMVDGKMVFTEYHQPGRIFPIDYRFDPGWGVPGWVIQTRAPYLSDDAEHDSHVIPKIQQALGFRTLVNVPILSPEGQLLGCFELHNKTKSQPFNTQDVSLLQGLSTSAAVALENARLLIEHERAEKMLQEHVDELAVLNALGQTVNATLALDQTITAALQGMLNAVQPDLAFLFLREDVRLILRKVLPPSAKQRLGMIPEHRVGECLCGLAVRQAKPLYARDIFSDCRCTWEECKKAGLKSFAALPLRSGDEIIGVIGLASEAERDFQRQAGFLEILANQVSTALANARLFETAQRELAERKRGEDALRESEARLRAVIEGAPFGAHSYELQPDGRLLLTGANPSAGRILGIDHEKLLGRTIEDAFPGLAGTEIPDAYRRLAAIDGSLEKDHVIYEHGQIKGAFAVHGFHTGPNRMSAFFSDITERRRAEEEVRRLNRELRAVSACNQALVRATNEQTLLTEVCQIICDVAGYRFAWVGLAEHDEAKTVRVAGWGGKEDGYLANARITWADTESGRGPTGSSIRTGKTYYTQDFQTSPEIALWRDAALERGYRSSIALPLFRDDGAAFGTLSVYSTQPNAFTPEEIRLLEELAGDLAFGITGLRARAAHRQAENEKEKLRTQLLQAEKMEAVGRLAGGVAHDFNNMLQAISGNATLALDDLPPDSSLRENLEEIQKSAERSTDLTRQLLAFARKQTIQPKILDLNDTVAGMLKMLRRLMREDIDLAWMPGADLWPVKLDPSQIDQILANLCVNARDAIADTGKVTIETANVPLDDTYALTHPECVPGDYVMLAVSDTGRGMNDGTRAHLFEPFFTTKEVGKGTGLGLATVFGIVKQNQGLINVYTEPGQGTTFKIYLPRAEGDTTVTEQKTVPRSLRGDETVLLVEDEEQILNLGRRILTQQGYTVLVASRPEAALAEAARHPGTIHLLITDVVMPGMNGRELLQRLRARNPELKCLFVSGYTANVIAHHGVLDDDVQFLQKPFTIHSLAARVREILEQPTKP